jgi:pilus assembly protein Flp/PilA
MIQRRSLRHSNEQGASVVEYALLVAFIALVCIGAITFLGQQPSKPLNTVGSSLNTVN